MTDLRAPTRDQVVWAESIQMDRNASRKNRRVASLIMSRLAKASDLAGERRQDYLDDGIPDDDF